MGFSVRVVPAKVARIFPNSPPPAAKGLKFQWCPDDHSCAGALQACKLAR